MYIFPALECVIHSTKNFYFSEMCLLKVLNDCKNGKNDTFIVYLRINIIFCINKKINHNNNKMNCWYVNLSLK